MRVFLSSPGDVAEERKAAREILERLPREPLLRGLVTIDVVSWDDPDAPAPMLANLSPQDAVNRGLPSPGICDLTIVIFWGRMGTPLAAPLKKDGSPYLSGTEWEYTNALEAGKDILLYRRTSKLEVDVEDPEFETKRAQKRLVDDFFQKLARPDGSLTGGFRSYATVAEFSSRLRQDLESLLAIRLGSPRKPLPPERADPAVISVLTGVPESIGLPQTSPQNTAEPGPPSAATGAVNRQSRAAIEPTTDATSDVIFGYVTTAGPTAALPLLAVGCVVLEDPEPARRALADLRADLLHDPQLRNSPRVLSLQSQPFDYWHDDPEVRARLTEMLLQLSFEAYVWFARVPAGGADGLLKKVASGLLRDRLAAESGRRFKLSIDPRVEPQLNDVREAIVSSVQDIRRSDKRSVPDPSVMAAQASDACVAVAHYISAIVGRRLHEPTTLEIRTFERLHPSKIRLIHELGTKLFNDHRRPLR